MAGHDGNGAAAMPYEAPKVTIHGSVTEATKAALFGINADQNIPAGASIFGKLSA
ncbi:MAG: lasso RiPP family leader peptide-containing protein [Acidimicrobiales bacterium]